MQRFLKNYRVSVPVALVLLSALALLAFGYFGVHKLWIDDRVDEAAPTLDGAPTVFASGEFISRDHPTSGTAEVLGDSDGSRFLRFEQFETDNGPDLKVYLVNSSTGDVSDYVSLGGLKGNIGDQNYDVPDDVDLAVYDTVLIWCERFSAPFGEAALVVT